MGVQLSKEALLLPEAIPHPEVLLLDVECGFVLYSLTLSVVYTNSQR